MKKLLFALGALTLLGISASQAETCTTRCNDWGGTVTCRTTCY